MEFTANTKDLKKTFFIMSLSVGEASEVITGHTLFDVKEGQVFLYSTDNDRFSMSYLPVTDLVTDGDIQFTADPKKIQKLVSTSDSDAIRFVYEKDTKTLNVYASDNSDAYVSFASFAPEDFLTFDKEVANTKVMKTVNAKVFLSGIKFMQGFLPDKDTNKKYSNIYFIDGAMYSSNGSNKIGGFACEDLQGINVTLRQAMLSDIGALIDASESEDINISETEKIIIVSTKDQLNCFAFRKTTVTAPKLPLSLKAPETEHITLEKSSLLKKLNRLAIAYRDEFGIRMKADATDLSMETIADRKSYERMPCKGATNENPVTFNVECNKFKFLVGFFQASSIDLYLDPIKYTIFCNDNIALEVPGKEPVLKNYTAVGVQTLAKVV